MVKYYLGVCECMLAHASVCVCVCVCVAGVGGEVERERESERKYSHYNKLSNLQCVINTYKIIHIKSIQRKTIYIRYRHSHMHYKLHKLNNFTMSDKQRNKVSCFNIVH